MFKKLGVQAYTFRNAYSAADANEQTLAKAFNTLKSLGYDEVQTAGFGNLTAQTYADLAHNAGLDIVGTHYDFGKIVNETEDTMRIHREILKTDFIGIGGMPVEPRTSKDALLRFIETVNKIGEQIHKYGFKFTYHNHHFEFVKFADGKSIMDYLYEGLDPETTSFVLDTHWVQRGGGNPTTWIEKLNGRIDILHLKDMGVQNVDGQTLPFITEIGNGNIDFDSVMVAAEKGGVRYYCVEQDTCPGDPMDSLKVSIDYIKPRYMK